VSKSCSNEYQALVVSGWQGQHCISHLLAPSRFKDKHKQTEKPTNNNIPEAPGTELLKDLVSCFHLLWSRENLFKTRWNC
jgi:hypothetical protein